MLFGVPGPASCSLEPDEPVLPLSAKEYSDFKMEAEQQRKTQSGRSFQENNGNTRTPSGAHVVQRHLSDSRVFVIELTSPPFFLPTAHQHTPSQPRFPTIFSAYHARAHASTSKAFAHVLPT